MKKLLCLFIVCTLFACSDYKTPFTDKKNRPPLDSYFEGTAPQLGQAGRFQMVAGGSQMPPFVIDTKEGYVWALKLHGGVHLKLVNFDKKYQSALEAVQAYSSQDSHLSDEEILKRGGFSDEEISQHLELKKRAEKHEKDKVPSQ